MNTVQTTNRSDAPLRFVVFQPTKTAFRGDPRSAALSLPLPANYLRESSVLTQESAQGDRLDREILYKYRKRPTACANVKGSFPLGPSI